MKGRPSWGNKLDFLLSTIGYAVGLGNIWRFPYLCYTSGGGAFLIPYFIMLFFVGIPLFIMEVAIGQYTRKGPIGALGLCCPLFTGVGVGTCVMAFFFCVYYNVIISWSIYYLYNSFAAIKSGQLPWTTCENSWNNKTSCWSNRTAIGPENSEPASQQYFRNYIIQRSDGIEDPEGFNIPLLICLVISWIIVYFALFRGIRWTGKVVYFTALFPYVILIALLGFGATLPGAKEGILYFIRPEWNKLLEYKVWVAAAVQNFNSIGICFGSIIAFASYNKFENNCVLDCLIIAGVNALTSLISGFVIFAVLGYVATTTGDKIENVVEQGPGLVFILYPAAFAEFPGANFWAAAFFFMLILLGIDSQFAGLEVILTSLYDHGGETIKKTRREVVVLIVCIICFIVGLPMITKGGYYVFELVNFYSSGISLMYLAFFECIVICWFYGAKNLSRNIREMTGRKPFILLCVCWYVVAPIAILIMWVLGWMGYSTPTVGDYEYPPWAITLGWIIAALSIIPIPLFAVITMIKMPGSLVEKFKASIRSPLKDPTFLANNIPYEEKNGVGLDYYNQPTLTWNSNLSPVATYSQPVIYSTPTSQEPVVTKNYRQQNFT